MNTQITFSTAYAISADYLYLAGKADYLDAFARFTRIWQWYEPKSPKEWIYHDLSWCTSAVTAFIPDAVDDWWPCTLSEEGEVEFMDGKNSFVEKIPGAGVYSDDAEGWGYLSDLQQIGEHLYATGYSGQVYKRLAKNHWVHMDGGILQPIGLQSDNYSIQVINGPHENAIYVAGCRSLPFYPVRASFWDGCKWQDLVLPEVAERITNIYVESESRIWMCGANGTLLLGNAADGFNSLSSINDNQLFLSICKYKNKIYLGSNMGLFRYDPSNHSAGIQRVITNLSLELQDSNIVDAVDNVLWSIGSKDIARFDGTNWERINHPDNSRIGEEASE